MIEPAFLYVNLLVFVLFTIYTLYINQEVFYTAHDRSEFISGTPFFHTLMQKPFGLMQYVGAWMTQLFYYPALGSAVLAAIWILIFLVGVKAFQLQGRVSALMLLPVACLLTSVVDLGYWIYVSTIRGYWFSQSVGYLVMLLLLWAARQTPRKWHLVWYVLGFCIYPILGWFALLFILCLILTEKPSWQEILGMRTVGDLNAAIDHDKTNALIQLSEALQEKKIAQIADDIARRKGIKMVLIAGPSSSGKTTTCKRLSIQLAVNGIQPIGISLDDYFLDRELTPKDETGDYDFEHLHALNIPLLNEQMNALFRGEEVELPRYNFQAGKSEWSGKRLQLKGNEVLVVEGIHALNPELTAQIPDEQIYRVYASALTTILLDSHNYVPTTDNRLLRRIIRDHKYRGVSARETIRRWPSVRKGENRWIFPYQENADAMFNSAMLFELAVIKRQAEPLLEQVYENCDEYAEAYRLRKFLGYIKPIPEDQIPPTSLLREFLGGSSFEY